MTAPPDAGTPAPGLLPWEIHPALTEDRLRVCARLLAHARRDALAMASYELGDDPWSVGCRAFAFGRHRLSRAAASGAHNWLGVLDDSNHFVFLIEDVPVRFYRGAAEDPGSRALRRHEDEAHQLSLALGDAAAEGLAFRFAVETGEGGRVARVVFLALRGEEGATECFWPVPIEEPALAGEAAGAQLTLLPETGETRPGPRRSAQPGPAGAGRRLTPPHRRPPGGPRSPST